MNWLDHVKEAERWLGMSYNWADSSKKAADCLYNVMLEVTQAVMDLEKPKEKEER